MGVACTNCHDPHSAKPKLQGNALCLQCHQPQANPAFPSAAGAYDSPQHHHHAAGSAGAQCTACHMPAKNYMVIQPRPDHSMRIPRPDLTVTLGTPNACNQCHADKTAQWAADAVTTLVRHAQAPAALRRGLRRRAARRARGRRRRWPRWWPTRRSRRSCAPPRWSMLRGDGAIGIGERVDGHARCRCRGARRRGGQPGAARRFAARAGAGAAAEGPGARGAHRRGAQPGVAAGRPVRRRRRAPPSTPRWPSTSRRSRWRWTCPGNQLNLAVVYGLHRPRRPGRGALPEGAGHRPRLHAGARQPGAVLQRALAPCRRRARAARGPAAPAAAGRAAVFAGPAAGRGAAPARSGPGAGQGRQAAAAARARALQPRTGAAAARPGQAGRSRTAAGAANRSRATRPCPTRWRCCTRRRASAPRHWPRPNGCSSCGPATRRSHRCCSACATHRPEPWRT